MLAVTVHLVAGQAGDYSSIRKIPVDQVPRTLIIDGRYDVADVALDEHSMTAQAIIHQQGFPIVILLQEDVRISCRMAASGPLGEFAHVTTTAIFNDGIDLLVF